MVKKHSFSLELTPSQVLRFNELLSFLKDFLSGNRQEAVKNFQQPPKEFVEKILELQPLEENLKKNSGKLQRLNESLDSEASVQWVSPVEIMDLLRKER